MQVLGTQIEVKKRIKQTVKELRKELYETESELRLVSVLPDSLYARDLYLRKLELEDRIKKLESRIEALEVDVAYAINPANFS